MLSAAKTAAVTKLALLSVGLFGGMFMVPMNATLQDIGHRSIGSGGAVAVQHFFENLAMVIGTGIYSLVAAHGGSPIATLLFLGVMVVAVTLLVSLHLPRGGVAAVAAAVDTREP